MAYTQKIGANNPGVILLLVDQSGSMSDDFQGHGPKSAAAALAVNRVIYEIQEASQAGEYIKDRCMVGVIGYGARVVPIAAGMISELAAQPKRVEQLQKKIGDGAGGLVEIQIEMPVWVDPVSENGTPMAEAFGVAHDLLLKSWIPAHPDSFPPVVINITDGEPNDMDAARAQARRLMQLRTSDGNLLLFNAHISSKHSVEARLPHSPTQLPDKYANFLFDISSPLPDTLMGEAEKVGFSPQTGARAYVFNAGPETLIKLLTFGSSAMR
ncbi:MAG TPA: vWA domain-containing protein [Longimicrobium sp.]|jgi:hypothetical protein|uniref:vWA domain-containing protein n=1 Tax=Longimicrobium sp. TaxID=2029185 RepID=UPI002ED80B35